MSADFLHQREHLERGDVAVLMCDTQCNFMLLDDANFSAYRSGSRFDYYGGHFRRFPARIVVPRSDYWNVVIDLGGGGANIRYSLSFIKRHSP
jgi:hypothetical protein